MPLPPSVRSALGEYDRRKGLRRRLSGDYPAIKKLRNLPTSDQNNPFKWLECFSQNMPQQSQASFQVYKAVKDEITRCLPNTAAILFALDEAGLLTQDNFNIAITHAHPYGVASALKILSEAYLLTQDNFSAVIAHAHPDDLASALKILSEAYLLTQDNCNTVIAHAHPDGVASVLKILNEARLFTQDNRDAVITHVNPGDIAYTLKILGEVHLLTQDNFNTVITHAPFYYVNFALETLNEAHLLTQDNFSAVIAHTHPYGVASVLKILNEAQLFTQDNRDAVISHVNHDDVAHTLKILGEAHLLTQDNFSTVIAHAHPDDLASALKILSEAYLLTQDNCNTVIAHAHPDGVASVLETLNKAHLLTQDNFNTVITHTCPYPYSGTYVLKILNERYLLTQNNFNAVIAHTRPYPYSVTYVMEMLGEAHLLTQDNFGAVIAHTHSDDLASVLNILNEAHFLTQDNCNTVIAHAHPDGLASALKELNKAQLITQLNFDNLLNPINAYLLSVNACIIVWYRIPSHFLTQDRLNHLIVLARQPDPEPRIRHYVDQILNIHADQHHGEVINYSQSVHATSVHKSVSESAARLVNRYSPQLEGLGLEEAIVNLQNCIRQLAKDDSLKNHTARNCIERITDPVFSFTDLGSRVTMRQLLALIYLAIHDDTQRIGTLEDANARLINGLYEIQREYNLSEQGVDQGGTDRTTCTSGTFNKLVAILNGTHPDCEIRFITATTATLKFSVIIKEEAISYLWSLAKTQSDPTKWSDFLELIDRMGKEGVDEIWVHIKDQIADRMFSEFGASLYNNNREDSAFLAFIDSGRCKMLENLEELKNQFQRFQESRSQSAISCPSTLFARNHEISESGPGSTSAAASQEEVKPETKNNPQ